MSHIREPGKSCPPSVLESILRTKRTTEGCAWGDSLDNFFTSKPDGEDYAWTDVWTTSVLQELGVMGSDILREPEMRVRAPWPVLKFPQATASDSDAAAEPQRLHVDPFQTDEFPKLAESIAIEYLPEALCVHDPDHRVSGNQATGAVIHYKRLYPRPELRPEAHPQYTGHLYLTRQSRLGCGHHSNVYRASFQLPAPLETQHVAVVAKIAVPRPEARDFLNHEAAIYNSFPEHLAHEYSGYALVPGLKYPVPVGAVVPKFFGYYVPAHQGYDARNTAEPSPILLLEECGSPVDPQTLSHDNKAECFSLFLRLHLSGFLQKSAFKKNILVQPGPLTVPPPQRSSQSPSFRVIDFGRAFARPSKNPKEWMDEREMEVRDVQKVLRIPRHSMH
ncbi:hypothetical protein B0H16DRAFT_1372163 [Mycena metata]|uniref:Protein kinase domain-containing protein n=1 Tax=Mycena metata TaxID=1033252 RepID=A0AAD7NBS9_9AGAR|nr:hypothetical protein B0H16DRAFT_1372163 [Mycena metata]